MNSKSISPNGLPWGRVDVAASRLLDAKERRLLGHGRDRYYQIIRQALTELPEWPYFARVDWEHDPPFNY